MINFEQAREQSFLVTWKAVECFSGPDCWCRVILPVEPIYYSHPESPDIKREFSIVDAGNLDQQTAEYFVHLHNERLAKKRLEEITSSNEELLKMVIQTNSQSK